MKLDVNLGGRSQPWRIPGAGPVLAWLSGEPWATHDAAPRFLHLPAGAVGPCLDGLCGLVRLAAQSSDVRLELVEGRDTPLASFAGWMGIAATSPRSLAEELARVMDDRERALLFTLPNDVTPAIWADHLRAFLDLYQKLSSAPPFCVMVAIVGAAVELGYDHLDVGWPERINLLPDSGGRWAAYVHERVAWHTAGSLDLAYEISATLEHLPLGADRELERVFDTSAETSFACLAADTREQLSTSLQRLANEPQLQLNPWISGANAALARPVPWLARALLRRYPGQPMRRFLRAIQTCRPLAARLFGRCSDLEQRCRDHLLFHPPKLTAPQMAVDRFKRHDNGRAMEHELAPAQLPAVSDAWEFADFGELISTGGLSRQVADSMNELRRVRNALAHGCSVGWRAVEKVGQLERDLHDHLRREVSAAKSDL